MIQELSSQSVSASSACSAVIRHFEQISEAPDAVPRLRRFILDLAVRGKLVEQNPEDEPASELLKRIEVGKENITPRSNGARKELAPIKAEELPFKIPANWVLARAGKLLNIQYGKALPAKDRHDQGSVPVFGSNGVVGYCEAALAEEPAIIIGRKGSAGALNLCDGQSWTTDVAYYLIPPAFFNMRFLFVVLQTLDLGSFGKGVKPGLNRAEAYQLPVVVPPLAEQHRIVAKVEELMALCDELEAARVKREKRRDRLVAASLARLTTEHTEHAETKPSPHPSAFSAVPFFLNHLPRLTTRPEHIHQLRQTILDLAVQGKLVEQNPEDEPALVLLKRVDAERSLLSKQDRRAESNVQELLADEFCWEVPPTWRWRGLADLALFIDYRGRTPAKVASGVRLITAKNIRQGYIKLEPEEFVSEAIYNTWMTRGLPREGDVLFTTEAPMGNAAVNDLVGKFALAQRTICFRPLGGLDPRFVTVQILSPLFRNFLYFTATGLTAKGIKAAKLKRLPFAIPPLAEQHRIVAKVDELMALCDDLEVRLAATASTRHQLLEANLAEALAT